MDGEIERKIERIGRIQWQVSRLCLALLKQPLHDDESKSLYSAVIKLARLMVVQEAYERRREAIAQHQERGSRGSQREVIQPLRVDTQYGSFVYGHG